MDGMLHLALAEDRLRERDRTVAAAAARAAWARGRRGRTQRRLRAWWSTLWAFWHPR